MPSDPRAGRFGPRSSRGLATACVLLVSLAWGVLSPQASPGEQKVEANQLKAVYLYNFLQFVQWPESRRGPAAGEPFVIGIVGDTPLNETLEALQATLREGGRRPIRVIHFGPFRDEIDLASCHLLFVGASERGNFTRILDRLKGTPVLTVADAGGFLESGGMIGLTESGGRIRWMINRPPAERAGLRFNTQMLRLAIKVVE